MRRAERWRDYRREVGSRWYVWLFQSSRISQSGHKFQLKASQSCERPRWHSTVQLIASHSGRLTVTFSLGKCSGKCDILLIYYSLSPDMCLSFSIIFQSVCEHLHNKASQIKQLAIALLLECSHKHVHRPT